MQFETVFDAAQAGYRTWPFPAFGLIFVFIGSVLVFAPGLTQIIFPKRKDRYPRIFDYFYFGFALLWTVASFAITYGEYTSIQHALATGQYKKVEGVVSDFIPMPYGGHARESFSVDGIRFSYSDYTVTNGFNNTASHGGPIHEGVYVRIAYIAYTENKIIKLEVAKNI